MTNPADLPPRVSLQPLESTVPEEHRKAAGDLFDAATVQFQMHDGSAETAAPGEPPDNLHAVTLEGDSFTVHRSSTRGDPGRADEIDAINRDLRHRARQRQGFAQGLLRRGAADYPQVKPITGALGYEIGWMEPGDTRIVTTLSMSKAKAVDDPTPPIWYGSVATTDSGERFELTGDLLAQKVAEASEKLRDAVVLSEADLAASRQMGPVSEVRGEEAIGIWQKAAPTIRAALTPRDPLSGSESNESMSHVTRFVESPDNLDGLPARSIGVGRVPTAHGEPSIIITTIVFDSSPFDDRSESEYKGPGSHFQVSINQRDGDPTSTTISYYFSHPLGRKKEGIAALTQEHLKEAVLLYPGERQHVTAAIARQLSNPDLLVFRRPARYDDDL